jgi:preprotein translocase subunit SecE
LQVRALPDPLRDRPGDAPLSTGMQEQLKNMRDSIPRAANFVTEVWSELKKVHWPTRKETYAATIVVVVITIIVAIFLGLVDYAVSHVVRVFLS